MDYLMILLREYEKNRRTMKKFPYGNYNNVKNNRFIIMSKEYGFIKWLVDNDKIDLENIKEEFYVRSFKKDGIAIKYTYYEELLMLLSIQDNPIEFLISILK